MIYQSYAHCLYCNTRWKQRPAERDERGAVTVVGYYVAGPCRLCGRFDYSYEYEQVLDDDGDLAVRDEA